MFAPGTKIVLKGSKFSYFVVDDSLCEPDRVEVWVVNKGFATVPRTDIFADIINGAYVTSVRHNVTSCAELESCVMWCCRDCLKRWNVMTMAMATEQMYDAIVQDILERVGRDLLVDIDRKNVAVKINDGRFFVERLIRRTIAEVEEQLL